MTSSRLSVRVTPRAKRPGIAGRRDDGVWLVRVSAPPEDGRANAEVCAVIAKAVGLRPRDIEVVVGHTAREKIVQVAGLSEPGLGERLAAAAALR